MTAPGSPVPQPGRGFPLRYMRQYCFVLAVMMVLSVSVHPAMAEMAVHKELDRISESAELFDYLLDDTRCPGCSGDLFNGTPGSLDELYRNGLSGINTTAMNVSNFSFSIREIPLDGKPDDRVIGGARNITLPLGSMEVRPRESQAHGETGSSLTGDQDLQTTDTTGGSHAGVASLKSTRGHSFTWQKDLEDDPAIQDTIRSATSRGFTACTERNPASVTDSGGNDKSTRRTVAFTFTNVTSGSRFRFLAMGKFSEAGELLPPAWTESVRVEPPLPQYTGRIADYDREPVVQAYIWNVTTNWGFAARTDADVRRYDARVLFGFSSKTSGLFDVATYTYTNITTKSRFRFMAAQSLTPEGLPNAPVTIIMGTPLRPLSETGDPDASCWYWYLLIGLAVLLVIAAIIASIAIAAAQSSWGGYVYYKNPPAKYVQIYPDSSQSNCAFARDYDTYAQYMTQSDGREKPVEGWAWFDERHEAITEEWAKDPGKLAARTLLYSLFLFLMTMVLIAPPLVAAALTLLIAAILGLAICKGIAKDQNDARTLADRLNINNWIAVTERDNGKPVLVPAEGGGLVFISLEEGLVDGVPYVWNATDEGPVYANDELPLSYPDDPDRRVRIWATIPPPDTARDFIARYVRADNPAGPALKEFHVRIVPLKFNMSDVDTSSIWVGYGTSLAVDKKTDGMHIAYLDYSGTYWNAGKLMYRYGEGTRWDNAAVVDESIDWTTRDGTELARRTSIALTPDGNPWISYMDWKAGHLKVAHRLTRKDPEYTQGNPGVPVRDRFKTETVDAYSDYTGWGSSIAIDSKGTPHISYLRQDSRYYPPQLMYAHLTTAGWKIERLDNAAGKGGEDYRPLNPNVQDGAYTSIAIDSHDRPHISYVDYNRDPDKRKSHTCVTVIGGRRPLTQCNPNLQLMHIWWNGAGWAKEEVDPDLWSDAKYPMLDRAVFTWHGLYNSIHLDANDRPYISYLSSYSNPCFTIGGTAIPIAGCHHPLGDLKLATYDGKAWQREIVDNTSDSVGLYSSVKVGEDGRIHISYMDWKNGFLRYATKPRTGSWTRAIPDRQTSDTGRFTSLDLDHNGNPRIVYMDYKSGHVKYVYGDFSAGIPPARNTTPAPTATPALTPPPASSLLPAPVPSSTLTPHANATVEEEVVELVTLPAAERRPNPVTGQDSTMSAISPGSAQGTTVTYDFSSAGDASGSFAVQAVSVVPDRDIPESRCSVREEAPLPAFQLPEGPAEYRNIGIAWINPSAISSAAIEFSVSKAWLSENHLDPAEVVLMRQHDLRWADLPTTLIRQEGDRYYYSAATPGFSYFAVTDRKTARAAVAAAAVPRAISTPVPVAGAAGSDPAFSTGVTQPAALEPQMTTRAPAPAMKAEPARAAVPVSGPAGEDSGLPLFWIAIAALVAMIGVAGFFIGRRLWWQYQNPALFRKYD